MITTIKHLKKRYYANEKARSDRKEDLSCDKISSIVKQAEKCPICMCEFSKKQMELKDQFRCKDGDEKKGMKVLSSFSDEQLELYRGIRQELDDFVDLMLEKITIRSPNTVCELYQDGTYDEDEISNKDAEEREV